MFWLIYASFGILFYITNIKYCDDVVIISKTYMTQKSRLRSDEKSFMWVFLFAMILFLPIAIMMDGLRFIFSKIIRLLILVLNSIKNKLNKYRNK